MLHRIFNRLPLLWGHSLRRTLCSDKVNPDHPKWDLPSNYTLLAQVTDYVDKDVCFVHPDAPWRMRFSSDYDKVCRLNRKFNSPDVYSYWPPSFLFNIDHDIVSFLGKEYRKLGYAQEKLSQSLLNWATGVTRVFAIFPEIPPERLIFAHRHSLVTLFIDDVFEKSCLKGVGSTFGAACLANLSNIVNENDLFLIDLKGFESDKVDRSLINAALLNQEIMKMNIETGKQVLTQMRFNYHQKVCLLCFEYLLKESQLIKRIQSKEKDKKADTRNLLEDLLETRCLTVGFEMVLPAILPIDDEITSRIIQPFNPFVHMGSVVVALDNDSVSAPKEREIMDGQESPFSDFYAIKRQGNKSDMEAVRTLLDKRNMIVRCMEQEMEIIPRGARPAYRNILKYTLIFADYEYVLEHGRPNTRYGFMWRSIGEI